MSDTVKTRPKAKAAKAKPEAAGVSDTVMNGVKPESHASQAEAPRRHKAHVAHAVRGRVRIKLPAAKGNPALLHEFRQALQGHPGIDAIIIKPDTASLVIHYDPDHHGDTAAMLASLGQVAAAPSVEAAPAPPPKPREQRPPSTKIDEIENVVEEEAEFLAEHSHLARNIVNAVKNLDTELKRATNNNVDLKIVAPLGLAAFTFLEIGAAAATPMWITLVIFSMNHFIELSAHKAGAEPPAA